MVKDGPWTGGNHISGNRIEFTAMEVSMRAIVAAILLLSLIASPARALSVSYLLPTPGVV